MSAIGVTKSYLPDIDRYQRYIAKIFDAAWFTNGGDFVQTLTKQLEEFLEVKNIVLVANATMALQVAYKALQLSGEVITTPFSFVATTSSLVWENLQPVFVDIDPVTFCIDPNKIEQAITEKTSAILPVHVYGAPCETDKIEAIAKKYQLNVIYDAAPAFGVKKNQRSILEAGDISILSFHATKLFHTGEGGALVIKDDVIYEKVKAMINFGFDPKQGRDIVDLGINAKMNELSAAMGLAMLDDVPKIVAQRQAIDQYYRAHLSKKLQCLEENSAIERNYAYFPVVFKTEAELIKAETALLSFDIYPRRYFYPPLNRLPYLAYTSMPIAEDLSSRVLCLPIYSGLAIDDIKKICGIIFNAIN